MGARLGPAPRRFGPIWRRPRAAHAGGGGGRHGWARIGDRWRVPTACPATADIPSSFERLFKRLPGNCQYTDREALRVLAACRRCCDGLPPAAFAAAACAAAAGSGAGAVWVRVWLGRQRGGGAAGPTRAYQGRCRLPGCGCGASALRRGGREARGTRARYHRGGERDGRVTGEGIRGGGRRDGQPMLKRDGRASDARRAE